MQYMLMICHDETFSPPEAVEPEVVAWVEEMKRRGVRKAGDRFRPVSDAKTIRVQIDQRRSQITVPEILLTCRIDTPSSNRWVAKLCRKV